MTGTPYPASTTSPSNAPSVWAKRLAGYQWERQGVGRSAATVFRLTAAGQPELYVKAEPSGLFCGLMGEASRLRWLTASRRIVALLRRGVRWAAEGRALQAPRLQLLVSGLERRKGKHIRASPGLLQ